MTSTAKLLLSCGIIVLFVGVWLSLVWASFVFPMPFTLVFVGLAIVQSAYIWQTGLYVLRAWSAANQVPPN